jgi:hypothetical protein
VIIRRVGQDVVRTFHVARLLLGFSVCLVVSCHNPTGTTRNAVAYQYGPQFTVVDSTLLQENDTTYLGKPSMEFVTDSNGYIYIADEFWNHLVRYTPAGRIDRVFGRTGDGPGEFRSVTSATILLDTLVVQASASRLKVFNRSTGQFYFERPMTRGSLSSGVVASDRLVLALYDYGTGNGVMTWPIRDFLNRGAIATDTARESNIAAKPPEYVAYPGLVDFAGSALTVWGDSMLAGHAAVSYLVLYTLAGQPVDTLEIPVRTRPGIPAAALAMFLRGKSPPVEQSTPAISFLDQLWRLSDGTILIRYQRNHVDKAGESRFRFYGDAFLSVLSKDRRTACVDGVITFPGSEWPRFSMHGDTLLALDQMSAGVDSSRARSVIRRYVVDVSHCQWLPVLHRPMH